MPPRSGGGGAPRPHDDEEAGAAGPKKAKKGKGKKAKKAKGDAAEAGGASADGSSKMVSVQVKGPAGDMQINVSKETLLKDLEEGGAGMSSDEVQKALLDGLCDAAFSSCDIDESGELSFDEFTNWAGSDDLMSQIMRMFYY